MYNDTTAHVGNAIGFHIEELLFASSTSVLNDVNISDMFEIDNAFLASTNGTGKIICVDFIESSGTLASGDFKLFVSNKSWTAAVAGQAFTYTGGEENIVTKIETDKTVTTYKAVGTGKQIMRCVVDEPIHGSDTSRLYCQLISKAGSTFAASSSLIVKVYIQRD